MFKRLRKLLTSTPSITIVGLVSVYLLAGFFLLPAVLKWQLEKQFADRGHTLHVGAARFDPLRLQLELDNVALSDSTGAAMFGFDNLMVDLDWRSIIDRTWTIADSRLLGPKLRVDRARDGRHNFSALLDQFASSEPVDDTADGSLPPVRIERMVLTNGRVEWFDQMLEQPLVSRVTPLHMELHAVSTRAGSPGRYQISVRTEAGEALDLAGEIGIAPMHATGELSLGQLQVATLARGLNRQLALQSPRGSINLGGVFNVELGSAGALTGGAHDMQLNVADLFLQTPGSASPLLAMQSLALNAGKLDLATREVHFDGLQIADASVNAAIDAQGEGSWATLLRPGAQADPAPGTRNAPNVAPGTGTAAPAGLPWSVSVGDVRIDRLALALRDESQQRSVSLADLGLATAARMRLGGSDSEVKLPQLRLTMAGLALAQGDSTVSVPSTQLDAGAITVNAGSDTLDARLVGAKLTLAQGASARSGVQSASAGANTLESKGVVVRNAAGGARVELDAPQWQAQSLAAAQAGQSARVGQLNVSGKSLAFDAGAGKAETGKIKLAVAGPKIQIDTLEANTAGATDATPRPGGTAPDTAANPAAAGSAGQTTLQPASASTGPTANQSVQLAQLTLQAQSLAFDLSGGDNTLTLDALQSQWQNLRLQGGEQELTLDSMALDNSGLSVRQGNAGAQLQAQTPILRLGGLAARRGQERADLADFSVQGARIDVTTAADGATQLDFSGMRAAGKQLALGRGADTLQLATMAVGSEVIKLALGRDAAQFSGSGVTADIAAVQAAQGGNTVALKQARWQAQAIEGESALAAGPPRARARISGSELNLDSLGLGRGGAAADASGKGVAALASAVWSAGRLTLEMADGPVQLQGNAMALRLGDARVHDPAGLDAQLLRVGEIDLSGAVFSLADQSFTAEALRVNGTRASLWLDAQGRLNLLDLMAAPNAGAATSGTAATVDTALEPAQAVAAPAVSSTPDQAAALVPPAAPGETPAAPGAWRVAVQSVALSDAAVQFEDRRREPALVLALEAIALNLTGLDTASEQPMQIDLNATLASGGQVQVKGTAVLASRAADVNLVVTGLALAPVQPMLSDYLELTLASGTASTQGRLTYGKVPGAASASALSYTGGFAVDQLLLEEMASRRPFLAWDSVKSGDLTLTLEPNRVDIGEIQVAKLAGRLIIAEDQSINLTDVLKKRPDDAADAPTSTPARETAPADGKADPFPVTIARVRLIDGLLEFADLSLRPQFGARMHELKGVITGLGTDPDRSAKVQLDARVDKFGSARIRGEMSVLQPEKLTEIDMAFRNLEMTSLSPYVAKFAGYEIASGRLSLDLQYKVRDSKLLGENKVVLNKVELGKKVESPDSLNLPLDLALAILKDANGVIDIGLPVRGDLGDPQFDYGAVIGKAIGNLLGSIVTAPFRALGALFGGGDKEIDTIAFEPGGDTLAPPEQQKIETVARALKERPNLLLKVAPVYSTKHDTPVLQSLAVRSDIAVRMGLEVGPGEDPGPIDAANPRVAPAVEAAFSARYAPAVLEVLKQRAMPKPDASASAASAASAAPSDAVATPDPKKTGTPPPAAATPVAPAQPVRLPPAFYQGLIDRMIAEQAVTEPILAQLAARRAGAVVTALTGEGGVKQSRVVTGEVQDAAQATDTVVPLKLELDVAK
jgi:hypothetical protein